MRKVLVVEDHPDMLEVLTCQVEMMGFSVIPAKHGKEGVKKALEEKPNLILMDIMMPEMDGVEMIGMLRGDGRTKNIPIIFITSLVEENEVKDGFIKGSKGVDQYFISKPFNMEEVLHFVQVCIGKP